MKRIAFAYAASAAVHTAVCGILAAVGLGTPVLEYSVRRGEAITLVASMGAAAAEPETEPVTVTRNIEPLPPAPLEVTPSRRDEVSPVTPSEQTPEYELREERVEVAPHLAQRITEERPSEVKNVTAATPRRSPEAPLPTPMNAEVLSSSAPASLVLEAGAKVSHTLSKLPNNPAPDYPLEARRAGWEGRVVLVARVSAAGLVDAVEIHESSGYAVLDESALRAVRRWRFSAAPHRSTPARVLVPVRFALRR
jgi:protein TonB